MKVYTISTKNFSLGVFVYFHYINNFIWNIAIHNSQELAHLVQEVVVVLILDIVYTLKLPDAQMIIWMTYRKW